MNFQNEKYDFFLTRSPQNEFLECEMSKTHILIWERAKYINCSISGEVRIDEIWKIKDKTNNRSFESKHRVYMVVL